jgi:hypothetical protein
MIRSQNTYTIKKYFIINLMKLVRDPNIEILYINLVKHKMI